MVKIKDRLYRCCFKYALSKLIVDNRVVDPWRRIHLRSTDSSKFTRHDRSSGTRSRIDRVYTDINIASNTKIHHIMVSFTDHHNAIFIDRFSSQTKIGKDSWYFNNSLLCKPEFSSTTNTFFIRNSKNATIQQMIGGKTLNLVLKMLERFLKIQKNIRISILKRRLRNLYKKNNFKPEIKPMIENLQNELSQLENKQAKSVKLRANTLDGS